MALTFRAISEDSPGPKWASLFSEYRDAYLKWWGREGFSGRPTYLECRRAIKTHMPELLPIYERLCELAGNGDAEARFLSVYCPPAYLTGCSQAIWSGDEPLLVRNYDYDPEAVDGILLKTAWAGRRVIGMSDGLFGLVDGMNDAGLVASLTFGGRPVTGEGFGVPLILRYILQICTSTDEAAEVLLRVPCHMSYNVTVVDRNREYLTAFLAPDREPVITHAAVATNHQEKVEWKNHARFTATVERERFLLQRLSLHPESQQKFTSAFLKPPLYSLAFNYGFGTLYTAAYRPLRNQVELLWPGQSWVKTFDDFAEDSMAVAFPAGTVA